MRYVEDKKDPGAKRKTWYRVQKMTINRKSSGGGSSSGSENKPQKVERNITAQCYKIIVVAGETLEG